MSQTDCRDRIKSAIAAAALQGLLGYAFITGLGIDVAAAVSDELKVFEVPGTPAPPPIKEAVPAREESEERAERIKPAAKDPEGAAAPPNLKASPTQIVAPPPEVRLPIPPPIVAAPVAGPGSEASAGASTRPGPGTGAGGQGTGLGSGAYGSGTGGGGGGGVAVPAMWIGGRVQSSDYPPRAFAAGIGGTVSLRFVVTPNGRVGACTVTRSSGNAELDRATCPILRKRLRYRPARDAWGRRIAETVEGEHEWATDRAPDRWVEPTIPDDSWE